MPFLCRWLSFRRAASAVDHYGTFAGEMGRLITVTRSGCFCKMQRGEQGESKGEGVEVK